MTFHNLVILMHRPFIGSQAFAAGQHHAWATQHRNLASTSSQFCTRSADAIVAHLETFERHYVLRYIPFVAVHCVLDAATVHVLNMFSDDERLARKARKAYEVSIRALEEISETWGYAGKAISILVQLKEERQAISGGFPNRGWLSTVNDAEGICTISSPPVDLLRQSAIAGVETGNGDVSLGFTDDKGLQPPSNEVISMPPTSHVSDQIFWDQLLWNA